ncbi:MAG: hypothetical protein SFX19_05580 [Alphaproteobacteria bacterium]|nr:hypothetical protein [Alphaproteobacteria bacterium]
MDTEKYHEMQEKILAGKPVTDEGPYYHHIQWEAYKGWSKGKIGGAAIGTLIGSIVGGAAAFAMLPLISPAAAGVGVLAFAGIGMWKGMDEFSKIGTITGAVAAGLDTAERRNQLYLDNKINEVKAELGDKGAQEALAHPHDPVYRTTHYVPPQDPSMKHGPVFWKVALAGLAIGLAAGLLLASGGIATGFFEHIMRPEVFAGLGGEASITALSMATFGAFGASFGINRDIFRRIFDHTDAIYEGHPRTIGEDAPAQMVSRGLAKNAEKDIEKQTVFYESALPYPESDTYHRDKYAAAKQVLQEMDHTKMLPH